MDFIKTERSNKESKESIVERPSWDEYFTEIAKVTATRSPCKRLHVGCVLVKDNRIVSQGYNGYLPGSVHMSVVREDHEQAIVHAEQNALCDCAKRGVSSEGCTAYITHFPCLVCCRLLIASGIKSIKYIDDYNNDGLVYHFTEQTGTEIMKL